MSGSISRSSRLVMRFTALTMVFGDHAVDGGGARRAPAPSEAGDAAPTEEFAWKTTHEQSFGDSRPGSRLSQRSHATELLWLSFGQVLTSRPGH